MAKYRGIDHAITGKSKAETMFNRKVRGKLLEVYCDHHQYLEIRERDAELKAKTSSYVDEPRNAQLSEIQFGGQVPMRENKINKLSTQFHPTPHLNKGRATTMGHNLVKNTSMLTKSGHEQPQRQRRPVASEI